VLELAATQGALPEETLVSLADTARNEAHRLLPRDQYMLLTRENMEAVVREIGGSLSCAEGACEVDTLRNVQARYGIHGRVSLEDGTYHLAMKLYDAKSGELLAPVELRTNDRAELRGLVAEGVRSMLQSGLRVAVPVTTDTAGARSTTGYLSVTTVPAGTLLVDGVAVGPTPVKRRPLAPGQYLVTVVAPGYVVLNEAVRVEPGFEQVVIKTLAKAAGHLDVRVTPPGANVTIDGSVSGVGRQGPFDAGQHRVRASATGFQDHEVLAEVLEGKTTPVVVALVPLPGKIVLTANAAAACKVGEATAEVTPDRPAVLTVPAGEATVVCSRDAEDELERVLSILPGRTESVVFRFDPKAVHQVGPRGAAEEDRGGVPWRKVGVTAVGVGIVGLAVVAGVPLVATVIAASGALLGDTLRHRQTGIHPLPPSLVVASDLALVAGLLLAGLVVPAFLVGPAVAVAAWVLP
jgi:hypothetical protein